MTEILARLPELDIPDAWLVSGCLFQTVWNVLADEIPTRAIKDYDLFYFDASDVSAEGENRANRHAETVLSELECDIDVRNQARVHLWYEAEFGVGGYPRLEKSTDGIDNFLAICCMVAVRRTGAGDIELYAPLGAEDILNRIVRQNPWYPNAPQDCYETKAARWSALWPDLQVEPFAPTKPVRARLRGN